ncbi:MAG: helix-turn-helix domain-containing protein [Chloroflexota bacterium]|nr:helix-turn-helix domain-containing protein [Chloroflexota bacterium]
MTDLGKTLSQARVQRGLTLEDCERDTRISKRYLDALEREDWAVFPAPVYSRAFLRTYAQYLGLNPAELMRLFHAQTDEPPAPFTPPPEMQAPPATGAVSWLMAGGVLVILAIVGAFLWYSSGSGTTKTTTIAPLPAITTEALGGGQQPAVGKPPPADVKKGTVPDLKDVRLDDALTALAQASLSYVVVETASASGQPGVVASQDPAPGTKGGSGTSVTLVVPRG